jgi:hypothetical protein
LRVADAIDIKDRGLGDTIATMTEFEFGDARILLTVADQAPHPRHVRRISSK